MATRKRVFALKVGVAFADAGTYKGSRITLHDAEGRVIVSADADSVESLELMDRDAPAIGTAPTSGPQTVTSKSLGTLAAPAIRFDHELTDEERKALGIAPRVADPNRSLPGDDEPGATPLTPPVDGGGGEPSPF